MLSQSLRYFLGIVVALASLSPAVAQTRDPLTQFLDGVFKRPAGPSAPAQQQPAQPQAAPAQPPAPATQAEKPATRAKASTKKTQEKKTAAPKPKRAAPQQAQPKPEAQPQQEPQTASKQESEPQVSPAENKEAETKPVVSEPLKPAGEKPVQAAEEPKPQEEPAPPAQTAEPPKPEAPPVKQAEPKPARSTPTQAAPAATTVAAPAPPPTPTSPPVPRSPAAALDQVNAYFNNIDQLTAYFVQKNPNGQQAEGTLAVKRPGILQFAYAPPSTLEIVSDGRNVAIRDKKLGTNDVYPVGQTPLKFLLQENVDLGRDTRIRDVQVARDGMVTVRFDDSATLGGTSKITLRYDSRANALKQWTIVDAQGYETSVTLSGLNVVQRQGARAAN